jgi:hypothetical protein
VTTTATYGYISTDGCCNVLRERESVGRSVGPQLNYNKYKVDHRLFNICTRPVQPGGGGGETLF